MNNPFKFGTIVDGEYFTDRVAEQEKVREILASENHLILISPRRFGKTSLVQKVTKGLSRPVFQLNLQLVTGTADFAARLLRIVLQQYSMERLKHLITHFRFIPTISTNPMTDGIEVSFQPSMDGFILLEDVFTLIDKLGMKNPHKKPIVVLDEFQEIRTLDKNLDDHQACWIALKDVMTLAFDHNLIIKEAMTYIRQFVEFNPSMLFELLPRKFTAAQLRTLFELVYDKTVDVRNFHKKIAMMEYVVPLEEKQQGVAHRAARYYKFDKKVYNKVRR